MPDIKNDDIEALFRKAAQNYQLDTSGATAWEDVKAAIQTDPEPSWTPITSVDKCRLIVIALLLLPLCWLTHQLPTHSAAIAKLNTTNRPSLPQLISNPGDIYKSPNHAPHFKSRITAKKAFPVQSSTTGRTNPTMTIATGIDTRRKPANPSISDHLPIVNTKPPAIRIFAKPKKDQKKKELPTEHYFYLGLTTAIDGSFINRQKISRTGTGIGLLFGYQLTRKVSIETGFIAEKKFYYTSGQYFKTDKTPWFSGANTKIDHVRGYYNLIEIPLNLQYVIRSFAANQLYAGAGLSTYIVGHENDDFTYTVGSNTWTRSWAYSNRSGIFFSVLSIDARYKRYLSSTTALCVQPYLKLPLIGFGSGDLKLASTGINLTMTTKIP